MVIGSHGDVMGRHGRREMIACLVHIAYYNNASLWRTLQATLLFYLMYVCVFIYRNDSLLMTIYKYETNI